MAEVWNEIRRARERAHSKHGDNSIEAIPGSDPRWLSILAEELGEIAHELTYDSGGTPASLRRELIDLLAVGSAWVDALDGRTLDTDPGCTVCGRDNRNGTHDALERTGHLRHPFTI